MSSFIRTRPPPPAMGMTSVVLGVISLLLFFMPILGLPLSLCGVVLGIVGIIVSFAASRRDLRWCLIGVAASMLALAINVGIAFAPAGYLRDHNVTRPWQPVPNRSATPPPANPKW